MAHAWRLTFAYDGDRFSLKSKRKLEKRVARGQSGEAMARTRAGCFIEVRGGNDEILYRRAITELLSDTVEHPTGDPARPLGRVAAPRRGEVSVLVPDLSGGRTVAIVAVGRRAFASDEQRSAASPGAEGIAARDLITVELPREEDAK